MWWSNYMIRCCSFCRIHASLSAQDGHCSETGELFNIALQPPPNLPVHCAHRAQPQPLFLLYSRWASSLCCHCQESVSSCLQFLRPQQPLVPGGATAGEALGCSRLDCMVGMVHAHFGHTGVHRTMGVPLMSSDSIFCLIPIVQCAAPCCIYCTLFTPYAVYRSINFLLAFSMVLIAVAPTCFTNVN